MQLVNACFVINYFNIFSLKYYFVKSEKKKEAQNNADFSQ